MPDTDGSEPVEFIHRLPKVRLVDRTEFVVECARGKSVIHLGFADTGCLYKHRELGAWLHDRLQGCATSLVGIDLDSKIVQWAQREGFTALQADCTNAEEVASLALDPADVVIAGELIEHVNDAGSFLDAIRPLVRADGRLLLTTPNCYSMSGFLAVLGPGYEIVHPDHVTVYSYSTMLALLARHRWTVTETYTYGWPQLGEKRDRGFARRVQHAMLTVVAKAEHFVARWRPFIADGLIFVCRPEPESTG